MRDFLKAILAAGAALALGGAATAQTADTTEGDATEARETLSEYAADTVVATVAGGDITLGDLIAFRAGLPPQVQQALTPSQLFEGALDQLISQRLFYAAGDAEGLGDDPVIAQDLEAARREIISRAYITRKIEPELTEDALKKRYASTIEAAPREEEVRARHILVETEETAKELKGQLDEGADFAELAKEHSTGPSKVQGGDLGFFTKDRMVAPFADAAFALQPGEISEPVQTDFGWHLIKLEERRLVEPPSFESMAGQMRSDLASELIVEELDRLREAADVSRAEVLPPYEAIREDALLSAEE